MGTRAAAGMEGARGSDDGAHHRGATVRILRTEVVQQRGENGMEGSIHECLSVIAIMARAAPGDPSCNRIGASATSADLRPCKVRENRIFLDAVIGLCGDIRKPPKGRPARMGMERHRALRGDSRS